MRLRLYESCDNTYLDAIGEYVFVSTHIRGTCVNFHPKGGFILGFENIKYYKGNDIVVVDDQYIFDDESDHPAFRYDFTGIRESNVNECIDLLNNTPRTTYEELLALINNKDECGLDLISENSGKLGREDIEKDFFKYQDIIKSADKILIEGIGTYIRIYIILNLKKVIEELVEINTACEKNNVTQSWP